MSIDPIKHKGGSGDGSAGEGEGGKEIYDTLTYQRLVCLFLHVAPYAVWVCRCQSAR